jgi:uracil phosphoribosyltransferase
MANLPNNAHVSTHPCLQAKLSQLRSAATTSKDVQTLVHEIATMVGYEALASGLTTKNSGNVSHAILPCCTPKQTGASSPHRCQLDPSIHIPYKHRLYTQTMHIIHAMLSFCTTLTDATHRTNLPLATPTPQPPLPPRPAASASSPSCAQASPWCRRFPPSFPHPYLSTT